jgi:hypothetical protein
MIELTIKNYIKSKLIYTLISEVPNIKGVINGRRVIGWPYCTDDEGSLLYLLAQVSPDCDALEVGFATGSTGAYILAGLNSGTLTSIDYAPDRYFRSGTKLINDLGFHNRHTLIEEDSAVALPKIYESSKRFHLIFVDGWKSFDRIWVDIFYCAHIVNVGGYIVFDDGQMPAVRQCISLLVSYYKFEFVDTYPLVGGWRLKLWHFLTIRSFHPPYVALKKVCDIKDTAAGSQYDFWKPL